VARAAVASLLVFALAPPLAAQPRAPVPLTLDGAIERALASNPALAAARAARLVEHAAVNVAGERPNPEAHVEVQRETPRESFGVALPLELGAKRARRIAVARADVAVGEAELAAAVAETRALVRRSYFAAVVADERRAVRAELVNLATRAANAAGDRFDAGSAPRLEVLQAELARAEAEGELVLARADADAAYIALNATLDLPLDTRNVLATPLDAGRVPVASEASAAAERANAELMLVDRRVDQASARIGLARALQIPDVTPEVAVTHGAEPEFTTGWRAAGSVAVPVFTRHRAAVAVEAAGLSAARAERAATAARVIAAVSASAATAAARREQYVTYRDEIVPRALEVERMAEDSYRLGETPLAALLQSLQASRDVRLRALDAAAAYQDALANLERAVGAPLP
jgi:cobalt-zinc-cadmium efflux system outer membrane protein